MGKVRVMTSDWHLLLDFLDRHRDEPLALVTLVARDGSSYRPTGARMFVPADGSFAGSLSGGCLEEGLARIAGKVIADGRTRVEKVDTRPHFGCPGILTFVIERLDAPGLRDEIIDRIRRRETFQVTTSPSGSSLGKGDGFVETVGPRPRLVIVGWTSDQEPLFEMIRILGWDAHRIVRDARMDVGVVAGESLHHLTADDLATTFPPDGLTALLVMSHHLATDLSFLDAAVRADYGYIGLLGSRKRREQLLGELGERGLLESADWISRLHAPMGLDLGAENPAAIALSILSEIQAVFSGRQAGFLRDRTGSIHLLSSRC